MALDVFLMVASLHVAQQYIMMVEGGWEGRLSPLAAESKERK